MLKQLSEVIQTIFNKLLAIIATYFVDSILEKLEQILIQEQKELADKLDVLVKEWTITIYGKKVNIGERLYNEVKDDINKLRNSEEVSKVIQEIRNKISQN